MEKNGSENHEIQELRAPYSSWDTFYDVFQRIRKRAPTTVDRAVLKGWGVSDANARKTLPALKFLKIVNGAGNPLPLWNDLTARDEETYRKTVDSMVQQAYKKLLDAYPGAFDETDEKLSDLIGEIYKTSASTRPAALMFLRKVLAEAGAQPIVPVVQAPARSTTRQSGERHSRTSARPAVDERHYVTGNALNIHIHVNVEAGISEEELTNFLQRVTSAANRASEENA